MINVILALSFVLGLLFLTIYLIKWAGQLQNKNSLLKKISGNRRINVVEYRRIDARHSVAIISVDGKEQKLILGPSEAVFIK